MAGSSARRQLGEQIDAIEGAYEFFLAYAAQGIAREVDGSHVSRQFREHLTAMIEAVRGLAPSLGELLAKEKVAEKEALQSFRDVLEADAGKAMAALQVVNAKSFATSQLVDNLNASIHIRTLLTDLFLLDEALGLGADQTPKAQPKAP